MSDSQSNPCGCCAGLDAETPARIENPPGQSAIAYRVGTHATFKESLLASLSSSSRRALQGLTTRADADFSIALCDALAASLDVLSFYQERIAAENLLRTATEQRSILELARLIGYQPAPGLAASTSLAFTLQDAPGAPGLAAGPVQIPLGTRVQSVPGPGEEPQTFETVEAVEARVEWNAIPVQSTTPWRPEKGDVNLWLDDLGSGVQPGDVILIAEKDGSPPYRKLRTVVEVVEDPVHGRTRLSWQTELDLGESGDVQVFVFRQRAALFGHNAPDPRLIFGTNKPDSLDLYNENDKEWNSFQLDDGKIDLDAAYSRIVVGSWIALTASADLASKEGDVEVVKVSQVAFPSRRDFGLTGKITQITHDLGNKLSSFGLRETLVLAQSQLLQVAPRPLDRPLYGTTLALKDPVSPLTANRWLAVRGKRARIRLINGTFPQTLTGPEISTISQLQPGISLLLLGAPNLDDKALSPEGFADVLADPASLELCLPVQDLHGHQTTLILKAADIELLPAYPGDPDVEEIVRVKEIIPAEASTAGGMSVVLESSLQNCYDPETVTLNANVAGATQGETVSEILGSGDGRQADVRLLLRQAPLTFISSAMASGRRSTLELRVNDLLWREVPTLHDRSANERVYALATDDKGRTTLQFGNGLEGARLPSGDHNIRAAYRKGLGLGGNLAAGRLTTLLSRPLGVSGVSNPVPAKGGEDTESLERARSNAPLTVRTLERVVSVRDYRDFARGFAGIAKAHAIWIPVGPARGIFLSVAGEKGEPVSKTLAGNLLTALRDFGDPLMPLRLVNHRSATFRPRLLVKVDKEADPAIVLPAVEAALRLAFGFEQRDFGQGVSLDQVAAVAQAVAGVVAVHVASLDTSPPCPGKIAPQPSSDPGAPPRLFAELPLASLTDLPSPAVILTLDSSAVPLEVLP